MEERRETKTCALCLSSITSKAYRNLNDDTGKVEYGHILKELNMLHDDTETFSCRTCTTKLNRINKIDEGIKYRASLMKSEKDRLLNMMREMPGVWYHQKCSDVSKSAGSEAKPIFHSSKEMKNLYEGCFIRGLPIGVPFKCNFTVSNENNSKSNSGVFVIVSYQAVTKNKYVNIVLPKTFQASEVHLQREVFSDRLQDKPFILSQEAEEPCDESEPFASVCENNKAASQPIEESNLTESDVMKPKGGRFEDRDNSANGSTKTVDENVTDEVSNCASGEKYFSSNEENTDVENIIITVETDTSAEDAIVEKMVIRKMENKGLTNDNREMVEDSENIDEVCVEGVFLRTYGGEVDKEDEGAVEECDDYDSAHDEYELETYEHDETDIPMEVKQQFEDAGTSPDSPKNRTKNSKRKFEVQLEPSPVKFKAIEEDAEDSSRRKSTRIRSVGYRPDYSAMEEKLFNDYSSDSGSENSDECGGSNKEGDSNSEDQTDPDYAPETAYFIKTVINEEGTDDLSNDDEFVESPEVKVEDDELDEMIEESSMKKKRKKKPKEKIMKKAKQESKKPRQRIKVNLAEHSDKYRIDKLDSHARKDRGKSKEEAAVEAMVCTICNEFSSTSESLMESHIELHLNKELDCDHCDFVARNVNELRQHRRKEHKVNLKICFHCGEEFFVNTGYKNHLGLVHDEPQYMCRICPKESRELNKFATLNLMHEHCLEMHPGSVFHCTCGRWLSSEAVLEEHQKKYCRILQEKKYTCEICGKCFPLASVLTRHSFVVHNNMRTHKCSQCSFVAANASRLKHHMAVHEGYHPYRCDQCGFSCVQQCQLVSHMRTHTGHKPYKCEMCNYAAAWKVQLKEHMKAHESIEATTCDLCQIVFKNTKTLGLHTKKEHIKPYQ